MTVKSTDFNLIRRLLSYIKSYKLFYIIACLCMLISTGSNIVNPIIVGDVVELFVSGYQVPFVKVDDGENYTIYFKEQRLRQLDEGETAPIVSQVITYNNNYYWLEDIAYADSLSIIENASSKLERIATVVDEKIELTIANQHYSGKLLSKEELVKIRTADWEHLVKLATLFLGITLLSTIFNYLQLVLLQYIGENVGLKIRLQLYNKILGLPTRFFNNNPIGKLMTRVINDTENLTPLYSNVLINILKQSITIICVVVMMLYIDFKSACYVFATIPMVLLGTIIFRYFSKKANRQVRYYITELNTFLSEHLYGIKIIQVFRRENQTIKAFKQINEALLKASYKEMFVYMIYRPFIVCINYFCIVVLLFICGNSALNGTMSIGDLIVMITYTRSFFTPIGALAESLGTLQSSLASAEKVFQVLDEPNEIENGTKCITKDSFDGTIEFKNVWFAYNEDNWILKNISFKIEKGQKVAFVGTTGAGKTSILSLIGRYYDIQKGQILIDGIDIKCYDLSSLRQQIGQVMQDVFIFTGDINSNIRLGNMHISDEDIKNAAHFVNANSFIEQLPHKYNEKLMECGKRLSRGQRQLIAFARAIAFDTKIIMLDEATANIDTETESLIQKGLQKLVEGRTTIMVAHRLSTIQGADNIIVIDQGEIKEMGNHKQLITNKGLYYKLYQSKNQADSYFLDGAEFEEGLEGIFDVASSI